MDEVWKPVAGYEGVYTVSNLGNVRRSSKQKGLAIATDWLGYKTVHLSFISKYGKSQVVKIAKLVAEAFIGPRPGGYVVCHNDNNKANNSVANLRYDTQKNNIADKRQHGTSSSPLNRGEKHPASKLTEEQVLEIYRLGDTNIPRKDIALLFGVQRPAISEILNGNAWVHTYNKYKGAA